MSEIKFTEELLASGELLDEMVRICKADMTKDNMSKTFKLLRSSKVWIACKVSLSDRDQAKVNAMIEKSVDHMAAPLLGSLETKDDIKLVPSLLAKDDTVFFPIFSSEKHMDKYGTGYVKISKPILEVIDIARKNKQNINGLVLNPFSDSFLVLKEVWPNLEQMESLIK